jgi:putative endonuclease
MKTAYIYIISNKNRTTLYTGVTSDLKGRVAKHKEGIGSTFTSQYKLTQFHFFGSSPSSFPFSSINLYASS